MLLCNKSFQKYTHIRNTDNALREWTSKRANKRPNSCECVRRPVRFIRCMYLKSYTHFDFGGLKFDLNFYRCWRKKSYFYLHDFYFVFASEDFYACHFHGHFCHRHCWRCRRCRRRRCRCGCCCRQQLAVNWKFTSINHQPWEYKRCNHSHHTQYI